MVTHKPTRQMRNLVLFTLMVLSATLLSAQKTDLKQAIKHFESKNLGLAEKEIERAVTTSFSSKEELSRAMYFYFMIKTELYCTAETIDDNIERLLKIADSFKTCLQNDIEERYKLQLMLKAADIEELLLNTAQEQYQNGNYLKYFYTMDHHILFLEMTGKNGGEDYYKLAQEAGKLGYKPLKIKYLRKVIKSDLLKENAYAQLISLLYSLKKYKQVDALLTQAKEDFPKSTAFAYVDISRLIEKDLTYSALQVAKKISKKVPENQEVNFLLGVINTQLNEHEEAVGYFQKVHQSNPNHHGVNFELGKHFYRFGSKEGNLGKAKVFLEKAYSLNPRDSATIELLHDVYVELGEVQRAVVLKN